MAQYIDADALSVYFDALAKQAETEGLYNMAHIHKRCLKIIEDSPTANVAPRADVAREIFAEIEQEILSAIDNNLQIMAEQDSANEIWRMCVAKKNTLCGIYDFIAELKKKYESEGAE